MARSAVKWLLRLGVNVLTMSPGKKDYSHHNYPIEYIEKAIAWLKLHGNEKIEMCIRDRRFSMRRIYFAVSQSASSSAPTRNSLPRIFSTFMNSSSVIGCAASESVSYTHLLKYLLRQAVEQVLRQAFMWGLQPPACGPRGVAAPLVTVAMPRSRRLLPK